MHVASRWANKELAIQMQIQMPLQKQHAPNIGQVEASKCNHTRISEKERASGQKLAYANTHARGRMNARARRDLATFNRHAK